MRERPPIAVGSPEARRVAEAYRLYVRSARQDPNIFAELILRDEQSFEHVRQARHHREFQRIWGEKRASIIFAHPESGKCETADSRVLLANGRWVSIAEIKERSRILLLDPKTCEPREAWAGPVENNGVREVVRLRMRSGRELSVTHEHPLFTAAGWTAASCVRVGEHIAGSRTTPIHGRGDLAPEDAALLGYLVGDGCLTLPSRVEFTNIDEGVLADMRTCVARHGWHLRPTREITYSVSRPNNAGGYGTKASPSAWVAAYGLTRKGAHDKRVPHAVFEASDDAVAAFVGAYFACDGHVCAKRSAGLELSSVSRPLLEDVQLLLLRFGIASRVKAHGRRAYRLFVTGSEHVAAFASRVRVVGAKGELLKGRRQQIADLASQCDIVPAAWRRYAHKRLTAGDASRYKFRLDGTRGNHRTVIRRYTAEHPSLHVDRLASDALIWDEVVEIRRETAQTWALSVDDDAHCYLSNGYLSHNTNQAVARVLWMLGHNPRLKILFVSKTISAAEDRLKLAKQYIIDPESAVPLVFPHLKLDKRGRNHSRALTVEREGGYAIKDASIKAVGLNGHILGARVDVIVLDDWIDLLIARTEAPRRAALGWFRSNNCYGRLTAGGRVIILTNAWHPTDPNEVLAAPPPDGSGFYSARFPSIDEEGRPTYPERWPEERVREVRVAMGEAEFARAHLCKPQEEGSQACKAEWLERCYKRGLGSPVFSSLRSFDEDDRAQPGELLLADAYSAGLAASPGSRPSWGRAVAEAEELMELEEGVDFCPVAIVHGVDSAFQTHNASDLSAIVSAAVYRNGHKRLLRVKSGRWDIVKILQEIEQTWCYFGGTFIVENNGGAQHIITALRASCPIRVFGFLTGDNKFKPGTNIQTLFAAFHDAQWIIPSQQAVVEDELPSGGYAKRVTPFYALDSEIEALSRDCLNFDPLSHTGDRLMAMWFVQRYAVRLFGGEARELDAPTLVPAVGMMPEARIVVPPPPEILPPPPPRIVPPGRFMRGGLRG